MKSMEARGSLHCFHGFHYFPEVSAELPLHRWKLSLLSWKLVEAPITSRKARGSFHYFHETIAELPMFITP